ncbi:hypothetical protein HDU76_009379 [Blyttiomyces sp. JEL0837]|nr:hypothetical protein HDU76_009379 [Blyttiomyces sp. JEL0837]
MGESRTELLAWLNDLCQLNFTKIEQCGTGAAHCIIMDSIYRDVPLSKCKFAAKHEYEYIANFKVLQSVFDKHKIDNAIPVERLVKCKFQDNLEFLQWMKKYWDQYYPGGHYDAMARRKGDASGGAVGGLSKVPSSTASSTKSLASTAGAGGMGGMKKALSNTSVTGTVNKAARTSIAAPSSGAPAKATNGVGRSSPGNGVANGNAAAGSAAWERERAQLESEYQRMLADVTAQTRELQVNVEQVEKEREFYFGKLREIEIFVQNQLEGIMYKTEEGFEIPTDTAVEGEDEMY